MIWAHMRFSVISELILCRPTPARSLSFSEEKRLRSGFLLLVERGAGLASCRDLEQRMGGCYTGRSENGKLAARRRTFDEVLLTPCSVIAIGCLTGAGSARVRA